ncbi:MAG: tRNA threonylcarbamoyladenosine biosynthesis [Planctomycetota bacterium]|nr:MAG: tRNA threonylcarbamoyladenosine biosynthesis [Planctomycetota bacterium]
MYITAQEINRAVRIIETGGLVAFPTETVYGLGADASNEEAVKRIYAVKGRPGGHPLIVHIADANAVASWTSEFPEAAHRVAARFWPGPLTLVLKKKPEVLSIVTGGQDTVALRVPGHPVAQALLKTFGGGIAAPSANRFGKVSPTTAQHVYDDLGKDVDLVLDGGPCAVGIESTILDLSSDEPAILRPGGITREEIEATLGRPVPVVKSGGATRAPGQLPTHYAPKAKIILAKPEELIEKANRLRAHGQSVVILTNALPDKPPIGIETIMLPVSVAELARGLYEALREVDRRRFQAAVVCLPSTAGLGLAVVDRLEKAAGASEVRE